MTSVSGSGISGAEFLRRVKEQIDEVDPSEVAEVLGDGVAVIDVRETEEFAQGKLPGAAHVPRGYLESRIDGVVPDRSQRVILYCASGNRSALAAQDADRRPRLRARRVDDRRHHAVEGPRLRRRGPARAHARAARALHPPPPAARGRRRGPAEAARREGAAARRRRPRLADRALPRRRRRRHARHRRRRRRRRLEPPAPGHPHDRAASACRRSTPPRQTIKELNPDVKVVKYETRLDASNIMEIIEGYDIVVDGVDNFPTRYLLNDATVRLQIPVVSAPRSSASTASSASSSPTTARATAASSASRRRPSSRRPAAPTACSACCRARWACCRRPRSSS